MCGIAGVLNFGAEQRSSDVVARMLDTIVHRGPDDAGICAMGAVTMGARRLKIIDLDGGHQPVSNEDGTYVVAYNGEIYNHDRLRRELEARGHHFRSRCDTEVVVHAWEEYGPDCIERFEGMFAFSVFDRKRRVLHLVRDRLGIKPLYYAWNGGRLVYASEIKALLASGFVTPKLDLQSLYHYIGLEFVPAPATMFGGIQTLPAGHWLRVDEAGSQLCRYWDIAFDPIEVSETEHVSAIRTLLSGAVEKRLMSDVPWGVFLSGGLDSTAVLAYARQAYSGPIPTFTIGYDEPSFSEWEPARRVARHFKTEHHEIRVQPITGGQVETVLWHLDQPMTDLSTIAFFLLSQYTRKHVTMCLSGEGGDEVFLGYDRFVASKLNRVVYQRIPNWVRSGVIEPACARLPDFRKKKSAANMLKRFVEGAALPPGGEHLRWQFFVPPLLEAHLFSSSFLARVRREPFAPIERVALRGSRHDALARESYVDLCLSLPESVLMKVDKMSMAHGLEVRVPFLDHALVSYAASIPSSLKLSGLTTRAIYRKAMRGVLPPFVLSRSKQGYSLPIKRWLRHELRGFMTETLNTSAVIREHFNTETVSCLIHEHVRGSHNHNHVLWALLNVALWHRRFIEQGVWEPAAVHR